MPERDSAGTQLPHLSARETQLQALFESNIIGIVVADRERIVEANDAFLAMTGYTREDVQAGRVRWPDMTPPEYREADECAIQEMLTRGSSGPYEKEYIRQDGGRIPVSIAGALLERSPFRSIAYVLDLTARKQVESDRTELARQKDAFVEGVAHDLKTPLTKIKGQAQLLQLRLSRAGQVDVAQIVSGLKQIDAMASRLTAQINGLLDITRIEMGNPLELTLRSVDLVTLVRRVADEQQERTRKHRIVVDLSTPKLMSLVDEFRLERVVNNLLSNAIKYSPDGGTITIRVWPEQKDGRRWVVLTVTDRGIGIPAADVPHIFERFHRAGNVVGRIPGNGVGLAAAKQIVEQHGGAISVVSREGEGSTFTVRLPLMPTG